MKNLGNIMKQAQEMQAKMAEMQERLARIEIVGGAGGGAIEVTMNGKHEVRRIKIDPAFADPEEVEVLEDLLVAACNDARLKVETQMQEEMAKIAGDLNLPPGVKLPF